MSIYKKLAIIQAARPRVQKRGSANVGGGKLYKYSTLDDILELILPMLTEAGIVMYQAVYPAEGMPGHDVLKTVLCDEESNETVTSEVTLPPSTRWHDFGSGIAYARRYGIVGLLNITSDDDDNGGVASGGQNQPQQQYQQRNQQQQGYSNGGYQRQEERDYRSRTNDQPPPRNHQQQHQGGYQHQDNRGDMEEVPCCPTCGEVGMRSKYPSKDGLEHFCRGCRTPY